MSRVDKKLRRKHRKEKKQKYSRFTSEFLPPEDSRSPKNIQLLSYRITDEPLNLRDKPPALDKLLEDMGEQLFEDINTNPQAAIPVLNSLLEQFPNEPTLMNWLSAAMGLAGDIEGSKRVVRQNFQANPNYLFARLNYAQNRLEDGDLDAVDEILDRKFDLKVMYPDRDIFHITEYRALCGVMIPYYIRRGQFAPARLMLDTLEELEPDGEATQRLRAAVQGSYLLEAARKLTNFALRRGRLPR